MTTIHRISFSAINVAEQLVNKVGRPSCITVKWLLYAMARQFMFSTILTSINNRVVASPVLNKWITMNTIDDLAMSLSHDVTEFFGNQ